MTDGNDNPSEGQVSRGRGAAGIFKGVWREIILALGFLTILPVIGRPPAGPESVPRSLRWFPLVGFVLGAVLSVEDFLLARLFGAGLRSALIVLTLAVLTGAVHLDGLADTADAFGAGRDRSRALDILRDSRIGSFGAAALFFVLALKILALRELCRPGRYLAICLAPALGRWAAVAVSYRLDYLRDGGAGSLILAGDQTPSLLIASATVALGVVLAISVKAVAAGMAAVSAAWLIRKFYRRWLGGVTGDLIGAAVEVVETLVLVVMAV